MAKLIESLTPRRPACLGKMDHWQVQELFFDLDRVQTLCRSCHIEKTRVEKHRELKPEELAWRELVKELA